MKKKPAKKQSYTPRLIRTRTVFEFIVRYPHGSSAISGYRRAARHFGLRTMEDPTAEGGDDYRVLIHKSAQKLRAAAKILGKAYSTQDEATIDQAEAWLAGESQVHYFSQDWRYWDAPGDEGTLENLGWKRRVVEMGLEPGKTYRVTLSRT